MWGWEQLFLRERGERGKGNENKKNSSETGIKKNRSRRTQGSASAYTSADNIDPTGISYPRSSDVNEKSCN